MAAMTAYRQIARALVNARSHDRVLDTYPGAMPESLAEGYLIQEQALGWADRAIGGWKIGRVRPADVAAFGAERLAGPIFTDTIVAASADAPLRIPVLQGFAAVEAEVLLRVAAPPPADCDAASAAAFVDEVRFGIEVASSPFVGINLHGPAVTVSDFGNNYGLVTGPLIDDACAPGVLDQPVALMIDGAVIGTGSVAGMLDGPFGSLAFLARLLALRGRQLERGQWISTGAITGVHPVVPGQQVRATFGDVLAVACEVAATGDAQDQAGRARWTPH
jgi:2-keto-4-pentenoate hydratase